MTAAAASATEADCKVLRTLLEQAAAERARAEASGLDPGRCCHLAELQSRLFHRLARIELQLMRWRHARLGLRRVRSPRPRPRAARARQAKRSARVS